jgi:hypothetical protein
MGGRGNYRHDFPFDPVLVVSSFMVGFGSAQLAELTKS